jgi:phosphohistidine phosphatase
MAPKRVLFLRHAKSSWDDPDLDDIDRPLNSRGKRAAARVGRFIRDEDLVPDLVLCSAARRTQETLERLDLPERTAVLIEPDLYGAPAATLLSRLRHVADDVGSVLMIGHNPGMHDAVATIVASGASRPDEFPTAALAVTRLPIDHWREVRAEIAHLESFTTPRSLG